ncbi:NUDIX hydrolase [Salibacter halophilus]|uniref:NUDIX domain-containing protein n=1 Tax=Salibacter halophilus TaxID=1803916 RepID=A0A6N6M9G9_9FLAO|nr:NUDIX domain-containing protein [Salibacter halophilus]KAB1065523.1 NUDIX domain-containing protein [Salibacter halophilus]
MKQYTIRVYAIIEHEGKVLLSDECIGDKYFTKFPGGGHEWGESFPDTISRELKEEAEIEVEKVEHFYTTDFFVKSAFDAQKQVVSIYYKTKVQDPHSIPSSSKKFDFDHNLQKAEQFRWVSIKDLSQESVTFPIDKRVVKLFSP